VGDYEGKLSLYLGTPQSIKDPKEIKPVEFTKFLNIGGREKVGTLISPFVCDWNEDGIPDILYGTGGGVVQIALGRGDRKDPELDPAVPVKGVDERKDFKQPSVWTLNHFAMLPRVVSKEEDPNVEIPEGQRVFHLSYFEKFSNYCYFQWHHWPKIPGAPQGYHRGGFSMFTAVSPFVMGRDFEVSFRSRGNNTPVYYNLNYHEDLPEMKKGPPKRRYHEFGGAVSLGNTWSETRKTFRLVGTRDRRLEDGKQVPFDTNGETNRTGNLHFWFHGEGEGWLDDVKVLELEKR
jgi:hypothetical protein